VSKVNKDPGARPTVSVRCTHQPQAPPLSRSLDTPTTTESWYPHYYRYTLDKFDEAVADTFATRNTMRAKFETMMTAFKQACTTLQHENQEFHRQLLIEMQTFQMNMFPQVVTCQHNTINRVTYYQPTSQQALEAQGSAWSSKFRPTHQFSMLLTPPQAVRISRLPQLRTVTTQSLRIPATPLDIQ
jgi:hypothetical protein